MTRGRGFEEADGKKGPRNGGDGGKTERKERLMGVAGKLLGTIEQWRRRVHCESLTSLLEIDFSVALYDSFFLSTRGPPFNPFDPSLLFSIGGDFN